jgi:hypothetical protein
MKAAHIKASIMVWEYNLPPGVVKIIKLNKNIQVSQLSRYFPNNTTTIQMKGRGALVRKLRGT